MTPLWAESIDLAFYIVTALLLTPRFGIAGLAFTRGMTYFLVAGILIFVLSRKQKLLKMDFDLMRFLGRTSIASLAMAAVSWMSLHLMQSAFDSGKTPLRLGIVCVVLTVSASVFLGVARLLRLDEAAHLLGTIRQLVPGLGSPISEVQGEVAALKGDPR